MPATQRGQAYKLAPGKWGLRYYDRDSVRQRKSPFPTKSAALAHYRDIIEPQLRGDAPAAPDVTLADLVELFLARHAVAVRPRTIATLRDRLGHATRAFGDDAARPRTDEQRDRRVAGPATAARRSRHRLRPAADTRRRCALGTDGP